MPYFTDATFDFLRELARHNNREWFEANRARYEEHVKGAAVRFIVDFGPHLARISAHLRADPRPVGGSLFRIYRDMRFARDRRPYKTHLGIRFPHDRARDVHAPGLYLHIEPANAFVACGIWRPDSGALRRLRDAMVEDPDAWVAARDDAGFRDWFGMDDGDRLKRAPRGYDRDHPLIEDLKRKDFTASAELLPEVVTRDDFLEACAAICAASAPFMRWLCRALALPF